MMTKLFIVYYIVTVLVGFGYLISTPDGKIDLSKLKSLSSLLTILFTSFFVVPVIIGMLLKMQFYFLEDCVESQNPEDIVTTLPHPYIVVLKDGNCESINLPTHITYNSQGDIQKYLDDIYGEGSWASVHKLKIDSTT